MNKGLILLVGIAVGAGWAQDSFGEETNMEINLMNKYDRTVLRENGGISIDLPLPFKAQVRKIDVTQIAGPAVVEERKVSRQELMEALKEAEAKRTHLLGRKSEAPPARLRGTVVRGSSLQRKYVPPVATEQRGLMDSFRKK